MDNQLVHDIELYPYETFKALLEHEVNMSRRYGKPITLIHLAVETNASGADAQHGAEVFAINILNLQVRETDVPCRNGNEFLVLMPATDEQGGLIVCRRLEKLFQHEASIYDKVSFKLFAYIGMASLPGDRSISSRALMQNASKALQQAREKQTSTTLVYSGT